MAVVLPEPNLDGCLAVMDPIQMLILKARRLTEVARPNPQRGSRARRYPLPLRLSAGVVDAIDCRHELRDLEYSGRGWVVVQVWKAFVFTGSA